MRATAFRGAAFILISILPIVSHMPILRILLVDDDVALGNQLKELLTDDGYLVSWVKNLAEARTVFQSKVFVAILLDVNLPDGSGFDFCRELRNDAHPIPIIFFTARTDEFSAVRGLSLGATDYLRKPFAGKELLIRLRRFAGDRSTPLEVGKLVLRPEERKAFIAGKEIKLTPTEYWLLFLLAREPGRVVTKQRLLETIDQEGAVSESSLATYLGRLRKKLQAVDRRLHIRSVYGEGYRFEEEIRKKAA